MHQVAVRLQERDIEILGLVAQFPHISADALTRFVMPEAYWKLAHTHSFDAQQRHRVTRPVRERMATLSKAGLVTIHTDAMGRAAYGVTQNDDPLSQALRGLIDNADTQDQQIALLWQAIDRLSSSQKNHADGQDTGTDAVPPREHFEADRLHGLMGK